MTSYARRIKALPSEIIKVFPRVQNDANSLVYMEGIYTREPIIEPQPRDDGEDLS